LAKPPYGVTRSGETISTGVFSGGSNGSRVRLWKIELQKLADELRIPIRVCHLPPGTSKWNKIGHRLSERPPGVCCQSLVAA
jgi:hypothetical protein